MLQQQSHDFGLIQQASDDGFNERLDALEGRIWLGLEWRALGRALESSGRDRVEAIADALACKGERRGRSDARMAWAASCHVGPRPIARLSNEQSAHGGCERGSGALWRSSAAKGKDARDRAQQARVAELRRRLVDGPVLTMPAPGSGTSDVVIPGAGTVLFGGFTRTTKGGRLNANNDILLSGDGSILSCRLRGHRGNHPP